MEKVRQIALFLASKRHTEFEWGKNDCNTMVFELHDLLYNEDSSHIVRDKYHNMKSAYRYANTVDFVEYLQSIGYEQGKRLQDGDIVVVKHSRNGSYMVHIALKNELYSMDQERGLVAIDYSAFKGIEHTLWRRK